MADRKQWKDMTKKEKRSGIVGAVIILFIVAAVASSGSSGKKNKSAADGATSSNSSVSSQSKQQAQTPAAPQDTNPHFSDGTYKVGTDIQPGTYRTRKASPNCYYQRTSDFSGNLNSILSNGNTDAPEVVTILPTDAGFKSTRCGTWTQDVSAITTSQTSFGDGTYIVGTDIQPGTYKSSGQASCYWSRLSDFTGGVDSILANENSDTPTIVTIAATDKGFHATRCGTWAKQ